MTEASEVSRAWGAVLRRWPVVVVAVLVGAGAFALWGSVRAPEAGYSATAKVRVAESDLPNTPTLDTVTVYANSARMKAAVVASTGLDPRGVTVSAAQDPKDKRGVLVTARAPESKLAVRWATAAAEQTRADALDMLSANIGLEQARQTRLEARAADLRRETARTKALAAKAQDPQVQATYLVAAQTLEESLATTLESLDAARFAEESYRSWVAVTPAVTAAKESAQGVVVSDALRGGLVGLFVGILIAALLESRKPGTRRAS